MENRIYKIRGSYNINVYYEADVDVDTNKFLEDYMVENEIDNEEEVDLDEFNEYIESHFEDMIAERVCVDGVSVDFEGEHHWEDGMRIDSVDSDYEYDDEGSNCDQYVIGWE